VELRRHQRLRREPRRRARHAPEVKPVALVADAILDCSRRKGVVLDAFVGSGTTLVAAERTGRRGFGIELDPLYCDVAVRRLAQIAGLEAVHALSGRAFTEIAAERGELPGPLADAAAAEVA
jgi:DNA modification methylase